VGKSECDDRFAPLDGRRPVPHPRAGVAADRACADQSGALVTEPDATQARTCVVFATRGRPETLRNVVAALDDQTRKPALVIISAVTPEDVGALMERGDIVKLFGPPGLAQQRNRALEAIPDEIDTIVFFDDDFVPHPKWLEVVNRTFFEQPGVGSITGHMAADGIHGPGMSFAGGMKAIASCEEASLDYVIDNYSPYGCNMAFRREAIHGLRFDERLVLYGWLEDRDFGGALAKRGWARVKIGKAIGAHLGVKAGRVSGRRLGYSQIVNPIYLRRKGTMTTASLVEHLFRNITSNVARSLLPEPHIDRFGRLVGNLRAARDLLSGVVAPERAELL
jgi:GT2 family glycosyltransferase